MGDDNGNISYILITAAHNEELYIEKTIRSVISQTRKPLLWNIISDGSTDKTDGIIKQYAAHYHWIRYSRRPPHAGRHFAAKALSVNESYKIVKHLSFDFIGNIDADISFEKDYFEFILDKLKNNPRLGITGTAYFEHSIQSFKHRFHKYTNYNHVPGQCQIFRRECFEAIGGYTPIREGGIDNLAVIMARMNGWQTRTFTQRLFIHHRIMGTGAYNLLKASYIKGKNDYMLGNYPLWEIIRAVYRMKKYPFIIGGILLFCGYLRGLLSGMKRSIGKDITDYNRREQKKRLAKIITHIFNIY